LKKTIHLYSGLTGLFGVLPGVGVLIRGLGVPPGESSMVYFGFIEGTCCLVLGLIFFNRARLAKMTDNSLTRIIIGLLVLFVVFFLSYVAAGNVCVVKPRGLGIGHNEAFFPFWLSGEVADNVTRYGSREIYLGTAGSDLVKEDISKSCAVSMNITKLLFIINYCLLFASLTAAFGFLGILQSKKGHLE
jgi:hypothetical protein